MKVAETVFGSEIKSCCGLDAPLIAPSQPVNSHPSEGTAVSLTVVPES